MEPTRPARHLVWAGLPPIFFDCRAANSQKSRVARPPWSCPKEEKIRPFSRCVGQKPCFPCARKRGTVAPTTKWREKPSGRVRSGKHEHRTPAAHGSGRGASESTGVPTSRQPPTRMQHLKLRMKTERQEQIPCHERIFLYRHASLRPPWSCTRFASCAPRDWLGCELSGR